MENCINEACPIYGTTNVHNCRGGTEMMQACKKYIFLTGDSESGANVPLDRLVRRCPQCKAPRKGAECWKCGEATFEPCEGWEEPKLPPIDRIRELAHEVGYAIGEHGSKERDFDVIAAPWTEEAVDPIDLLLHLKNGLKGKLIGGIENKPLGRVGANIQLDGFYKTIDISVCPKV